MAENGLSESRGEAFRDRYKVQKQLSQNEERETLLAIDLMTQEPVVIKRLLYRSSFESKDLKLFQREAETLKTLDHPSIPRYLDYFEIDLPEGKGFALVQTYIAGKSLQNCLNERQIFSEAEARQIAAAVLDILIYLHERQPPVIHRDIKPNNILLTSEFGKSIERVYLIDFSSVQNFIASAIGSFTIVGTYGYTPPEQLSGRPVIASDLYSLGATLVSAITGTDPSKLPRKGRQVDFEQCVSCSPAFATWLKQMTEPSLDKRFASARMALRALEQKQTSPKVPQKPTHSQIKLTQNANSLEIVVPTAIGKIRLHIDDRHLKLTNELMGWKYNQLPIARRKDLRRLECTRHRIVIWAVTQKYELGNGHLTEAEMNWLAYELSQWLKLAVVRG